MKSNLSDERSLFFKAVSTHEEFFNAAQLDEREKIILHKYWNEELTYRTIGKQLNISHERVRQIHHDILIKLIKFLDNVVIQSKKNEVLTDRNKVISELLEKFVQEADPAVKTTLAERIKEVYDAETPNKLNMSIGALELSVRTKNCCSTAGLERIYDLTQITEEDFFTIANCGTLTLIEMRNAMKELNVAFKKNGSRKSRIIPLHPKYDL